MPKLVALLVGAFEESVFRDLLGEIYMEMELALRI